MSKVVDLQDSVLHLNCQNVWIDLRLTDNKGTKFFEDFNSSCGKYDIVQMMHVSGHKTQKTFMDYIKLSSEELEIGGFPYESIMTSQIADELVKSANTLKFSTI